jgi:hypothetical protein
MTFLQYTQLTINIKTVRFFSVNAHQAYFANHYLAITDHHIKSQLNLPAYVRYMDDFVVWHNNPHQLSAIAQNISTQLHETLQLQLKTKTQNTCAHGLSFLGYRLFPHQTRLTARSKKRYLSKMIALNWNNNAQNCRTANRNNNTPSNRNNNNGFRLVCVP